VVQPNGSRVYQVGQPNGDGTVENGTAGIELSCFVTESGQFSIDLFARNQAVGLPGDFGINLDAVIQSETDAAQNTGLVEFFDPDAGTMQAGGTAPLCTFGPPSAGGGIILKAGALLVGFTCPLLATPESPTEGCRAEGTVAVEFCETGE
jgi:hypothetical protein